MNEKYHCASHTVITSHNDDVFKTTYPLVSNVLYV